MDSHSKTDVRPVIMPSESFSPYYRRPAFYQDEDLIMSPLATIPLDSDDKVGLSLIRDTMLIKNTLSFIERISKSIKFEVLG